VNFVREGSAGKGEEENNWPEPVLLEAFVRDRKKKRWKCITGSRLRCHLPGPRKKKTKKRERKVTCLHATSALPQVALPPAPVGEKDIGRNALQLTRPARAEKKRQKRKGKKATVFSAARDQKTGPAGRRSPGAPVTKNKSFRRPWKTHRAPRAPASVISSAEKKKKGAWSCTAYFTHGSQRHGNLGKKEKTVQQHGPPAGVRWTAAPGDEQPGKKGP